jgi:hypothetical protein
MTAFVSEAVSVMAVVSVEQIVVEPVYAIVVLLLVTVTLIVCGTAH